MPETQAHLTNRREFLRLSTTGSGALIAAFQWPAAVASAVLTPASGAAAPSATQTILGDGWIVIEPDNQIVLRVGASEMGQGVATTMPTLIAEELGVDVQSIDIEMAPIGDAFRNLAFNMQATGSSTSVRWSYHVLRQVGARVRETLKLAAANQWSVPVVECSAADAHIAHEPTGRRLSYGALAVAAAALRPPDNVPFKPASAWQQLGKTQPRLDSPAKVRGEAGFGIDVQLDGMLIGTVLACPTFGARLERVDERAALALPGVERVLKLPDAVIVLANGYWPALKGLKALTPVWDLGPNRDNSTARISQLLHQGLDREGASAARDGDAALAITTAAQQFEATYEVPLLAHAAMEPMNATARIGSDRAEIWAPTQAPGSIPPLVSRLTGLEAAQVDVYTTFLGGGFGRRFEMDFIEQTVLAAKLAGKPVKLIWSREEDLHHDFYRPAAVARLRAGLSDGRVTGLDAKICSPSIMSRVFPGAVRNGVDQSSVEGLADNIYRVPALNVAYVQQEVGVPVGFWRAVGHSQNAFFLESFVDELAHGAKRDPVALRQELLADKPRHLAALNRAAALAHWGQANSGRFQGIAMAESFGTIVAQVAELSVDNSKVRVHRLSIVADCGVALDPGTVQAQLEGAMIYGLTAAMYGQVNIADGGVVEGNFDTYPLLRMPSMPQVRTEIIESNTNKPGGIGEPGLPPIAPAIANAIFAATGTRVRTLPLSAAGLEFG